MCTVIIKQDVREELEALLPADRTIDIDDRGYVSLFDTELIIEESEIDG